MVLLFGVLLILVGGALMLFGRLHLPGDIVIRRGGATVYIPIATSLILSVLLTLVLNVLFRHR
ncbi:DUF2905 domain-containing protein [bacterium]|nr:MAG: DUF2905 domain-containing protein [bacterium]